MCVFVPVGIFFATNVHYLDEWLWSNNFSGRPSLFLKAQGSYMRCEELEGVEGTILGEILDKKQDKYVVPLFDQRPLKKWTEHSKLPMA